MHRTTLHTEAALKESSQAMMHRAATVRERLKMAA